MPLAALIIVGETGDGPPILGEPLIEFQLRRARVAGADHAVLMIERLPSGLVASIDRLKQDGMTVEIARTIADAALQLHPQQRVLLMAPDIVLSPARLAMLAKNEIPTLLCIGPEADPARHELIDAATRWTGFALIDGELVQRTAAMVGDWDPASTLMRQAVQARAHRMRLSAEDAVAALQPVARAVDAEAIGRTLLTAVSDEPLAGVGRRWLTGPASRALAGFAGERDVDPALLSSGGTALAMLAVPVAGWSWIVTAALVYLAGLIVGETGDWLGDARGRGWRGQARLAQARSLIGMAGLAVLAVVLMRASGQWGVVLLAAMLVGAGLLIQRWSDAAGWSPRWRGDDAAFALLIGLAAAGGMAIIGIGAGAAWALAGLIMIQRRVLQPPTDV